MPYYQAKDFFELKKDCPAFIHCREPGSETPYTGIYRCTACDWEIVSIAGTPLPSEDLCWRHLHPNGPTPRGPHHGEVSWKLMAAVIQRH